MPLEVLTDDPLKTEVGRCCEHCCGVDVRPAAGKLNHAAGTVRRDVHQSFTSGLIRLAGYVLAVESQDIKDEEPDWYPAQQLGAWSTVLRPTPLKPTEARNARLVEGHYLSVKDEIAFRQRRG